MNNKFAIRNVIFLALYFFGFLISIAQTTYILNVLDFGATTDGITLNTQAIQNAIDQCYKKGGGTVEFPSGTYLTGTIILKDNVILNLLPGSKILGSSNIDDYPMYAPSIPNNMDKDVKRALIRAEDTKNIGITGFGIIDGQGESLQINKVTEEELKEIHKIYTDKSRYIPKKGSDQRPFLLRFVSCKAITMQGITLQHPAKWTQHYLNCDGVTIRDLKIFAHGGENNDLVDIDGSKNVVITGLRGDSDDDGITLKSASDHIVENVLISDCILRSRTNPIKAGTDSYGGFRNITITNCYIGPSLTNDGYSGRKEGLAGITFQLVDGGVLENVTVSNIVIEEMSAPIYLRLGNRGRTPQPNMESKPIGILNNINISNIVAKNAGRTGCSIIGEIDHPITNVSISNIRINFDGGGTIAEATDKKPELVNEYPESVSLGNLPAYGFFVRHVNGITFRDVEFSYNEEEQRQAMVFNDVQNLKLLNVDAEISDAAKSQIVLQNTSTVFVNGCSPKASKVFLSLEQNSADINLAGNNFSSLNSPFIVDETIETEQIKTSPNLTGLSTVFEQLQPNIKRDSLGMVTMYYPNNANIFYTTDGSLPTKSSNMYEKPFAQIGATTILAKAFKNGQESSTRILKLDKVQVLAPQIFPKDQFFNQAIEVSLTSNTKGATIYYSLDGSTPNKNSLKYTKPIRVQKSVELKTVAIKNGYADSKTTDSKFEKIEQLEGVQYKLYELKLEKLPSFIDLSPKKVGRVKTFSFEDIEHPEFHFAIIMQGFIKIKNEGDYTFFISSNDGSKLFIDNKEVINNDGVHGSIENSRVIHLKKGTHLIEARYFQAGGVKSLKVSWEGSGFEKREITKEELSSILEIK